MKVDGNENYALFGGKGVEVNVWDLDKCTKMWTAKSTAKTILVYLPQLGLHLQHSKVKMIIANLWLAPIPTRETIRMLFGGMFWMYKIHSQASRIPSDSLMRWVFYTLIT
ncbi:uncharacterized protein LOC132303907 [Cornus florida]|uniref:uncharacterized protein LOC132303907 n=1 Tax=Cornus florida TaxID=4283 RepID=UPI0028A1D82D|nr:uncharacterized protein LOC132303907 [Cornus florida]